MRASPPSAVLAAAAALVAGCGGEDPRPGTLTVTERWTAEPGYIEGHAAFASVRGPGGRPTIAARRGPAEHGRPILVRRLGAGRYRVAGYVRSCGPICEPPGDPTAFQGDPPTHHCWANVAIDGDTAVTFVRDPNDPRCHVEIEQPPRG